MAGLERLPVDEGGMPMDVALKLQHLLLLLGTPDPQLEVPRQAASSSVRVRGRDSPVVAPNPIPRRLLLPGTSDGILGASAESMEDLIDIGRAFNSALAYVHDHLGDRNMTVEAHAWITAEIRALLLDLRKELRTLHTNRDNPLLLPVYAIDRTKPLQLLSGVVPHALVGYRTQFADLMTKLLKDCYLDATCRNLTTSIVIEILFPPGAEVLTVGSRLFDPAFENEFVNAVDAVSLVPK